MFLAAKRLYEAAEIFYAKIGKSIKNAGDAQFFRELDFRFIENPFRKRELEDIFYPLMTHEKIMVRGLIDYAVQKKLKGGFRKRSGSGMYPSDYSFDCNKNHIIAFIWRASYGLKVKITLPEPETAAHDMLLKKVNELSNAEEIKDFCIKNINYCGYCSKGCIQANARKKKWLFLERPLAKLPASCWGFGIFFPLSEENFVMSKILIDLLPEIYE